MTLHLDPLLCCPHYITRLTLSLCSQNKMRTLRPLRIYVVLFYSTVLYCTVPLHGITFSINPVYIMGMTSHERRGKGRRMVGPDERLVEPEVL